MSTSWSRHFFPAARIAVAFSLLFAAAGKAVGIAEFGNHLRAIGFPAGFSGILAVIVVLAEVGAGAGLLVAGRRPTAWKAALALLSLFGAVQVWRAVIGVRGDCGCFGVWFALQPWQSWMVLLSLCTASVYGLRAAGAGAPPASRTQRQCTLSPSVSPFVPSTALLLLVAIAHLVAPEVIVLDPQSLRARVPPLPVGSRAPAFHLKDDSGRIVSDRDLYGRLQVLLFVSGCSHCSAGTVMMWDTKLREAGVGNLVVLAPESTARLRAFRREYLLSGVLLSTRGSDVAERYRVAVPPMAYVVDAGGRVIFAQKPDEDLRSSIERALKALDSAQDGDTVSKGREK